MEATASRPLGAVSASVASTTLAVSKPARVTGRVLSGLAIAFLGVDALAKLLMLAPVLEGSPQLGWPPEVMFPLGVTLMLCTIVYAVPRTAVLGAILLTGYLGGAVATHVRIANPLLTHSLFPVYLGVFIWGGLLLRDVRLRALLPWRARS
jgi:hypothetical protein